MRSKYRVAYLLGNTQHVDSMHVVYTYVYTPDVEFSSRFKQTREMQLYLVNTVKSNIPFKRKCEKYVYISAGLLTVSMQLLLLHIYLYCIIVYLFDYLFICLFVCVH